MMQYYRREDGTICTAIQFNGGDEAIKEHLFDVMNLLAHAELLPSYHAEEITDEWVENEEGDDYEQVVIPQHIKLAASDQKLHVGDYVIERNGDVYVMAGEMFEAIWSLIEQGWPMDMRSLEAPVLIKIADICENCGRSVVNFDQQGNIHSSFVHTEGRQRGLHRCWPEDTGQPYGLDATPRSHKQ